MGIRITTSLIFTFQLEAKERKNTNVGTLAKQFLKDISSLDIVFLINMLKSRGKKID